jgi:hypothetical protein
MTNWVETQGRILSGHITSSEGYDQSTNSYQTYYEPEVVYQYEVNGVQYTGSRVAELAGRYGSKGDVEKFLADHPAGSTVKVYYDPADARNAVLEKGLGSIGQKQLLLAGGVIGGVVAAAGGLSVVILGLTLVVACAVVAGVLWLTGKVLGFF